MIYASKKPGNLKRGIMLTISRIMFMKSCVSLARP